LAVVPFRIGGENPTVVTSQADRALNSTAVLITGFSLENQRESGNASYDLRVGDSFKDYAKQVVRELAADQMISVRPGRAIIVETRESVSLPRSRFAYILPKATLQQKGLSNVVTKVDPGYSGKAICNVV
jgi:deoxycytidine triphosphate deaminase